MKTRFLIIYASFGALLVVLVAFVTGPIWGLRLDYERGQHLQLIQAIAPTLVSYLTAAVTYGIFGKAFPEPKGEKGKILRVLTLGSFVLFAVGMIVATATYYVSASGALRPSALSFDQFSQVLTILVSFLATTTTAITMYIFSTK